MPAPAVLGRRLDHLDGLAVGLMVVLCLCWRVQQVAIKLAIQAGLPPLLQAGLRSLGAAALLVLWTARGGRPALRRLAPAAGGWPPVLLLAGIFACEFVLIYLGLRATTASRAVLFLYTSPLFAAGAAHLLIPAERLAWPQAAGLATAFGGIAVAVGGRAAGDAGGTLAGDVLVTGGAVLWAGTIILIRISPPLGRTSAPSLLLWQLAGSAPILLALSLLLGERAGPAAWSAVPVAALVYQAGVGAFASYLAWYWLIGRYPAARLSAFTFLTPIFGVAAAALLGEAVPLRLLLALALVVGGLWLVNRRPLSRGFR